MLYMSNSTQTLRLKVLGLTVVSTWVSIGLLQVTELDAGVAFASTMFILWFVPMFSFFTEVWARRLPQTTRPIKLLLIPFVVCFAVGVLSIPLDDIWLQMTLAAGASGLAAPMAIRHRYPLLFDWWQVTVGTASAAGAIFAVVVLNGETRFMFPIAAWFLYGWGCALAMMTLVFREQASRSYLVE